MTEATPNLFGQVALRQGLITAEQLEVALRAQAAEAKGRQLGRILVERGVLTEADVIRILSTQNMMRLRVPENGTIASPARTTGASEQVLFGKYLLTQVLGRGRSQTYKVWDSDRKSFLALKIGPERDAPEEERRRFKEEAEAAARLAHPNLVKVHEVSEVEGRPYVVTDYVMGISLDLLVHPDNRDPADFAGGKGTTRVHHPKDQSLQAEIRRAIKDKKPLQREHMIRLLAATARAVHHAHASGVVHGNLKPHNIIADYQGNPIVTDFASPNPVGRARAAEEPSSAAAYLAPERVRNAAEPAVDASDVYSLGAVLYECLTGHPPYTGTAAEVLDKLASTAPPLPSKVSVGVTPALEAVCLKAMDRKKERRYATALALAEDLEGCLFGGTVRARVPSGVGRAVRAIGPTRVAAALGGGATLIVILVMGASWLLTPDQPGAGDPSLDLQEAAKCVEEARALLRQPGRGREAFDLYSRAVRMMGAKWEYWCERGVVAYSLGKYDWALRDFQNCIEKSASTETAYYLTGRIHMEDLGAPNDLVVARQAFRALLQNNSDGPYAKLAQARIHILDGLPDKALERLDQAEAGCPLEAELSALRGWIWCHRDPPDMVKAIQGYSRAIELTPTDERLFLARARILCGEGKYKEAVRDLDRAIVVSPSHRDLYYERGMIRADLLKDPAGARKDLNQALLLCEAGDAMDAAIRMALSRLK